MGLWQVSVALQWCPRGYFAPSRSRTCAEESRSVPEALFLPSIPPIPEPEIQHRLSLRQSHHLIARARRLSLRLPPKRATPIVVLGGGERDMAWSRDGRGGREQREIATGAFHGLFCRMAAPQVRCKPSRPVSIRPQREGGTFPAAGSPPFSTLEQRGRELVSCSWHLQAGQTCTPSRLCRWPWR